MSVPELLDPWGIGRRLQLLLGLGGNLSAVSWTQEGAVDAQTRITIADPGVGKRIVIYSITFSSKANFEWEVDDDVDVYDNGFGLGSTSVVKNYTKGLRIAAHKAAVLIITPVAGSTNAVACEYQIEAA